MYYSKFETEICEIILAGDDEGLKHLHLETEDGSREFEIQPGWKLNRAFFKDIEKQILEFLNGSRKKFDVTIKPSGTDFQKKVWQRLCDIPYGQLKCYGDIAKEIGNPKSSRAVGAANGKNPIPLIIPCHRVIGANGGLTGFAHGVAVKKKLIELEQGVDSLDS